MATVTMENEKFSNEYPSVSRLDSRPTTNVQAKEYKVITIMVIGPLDDCTYCARSAFTHLGLWQKMYECSLHPFTASQLVLKCALFTFSSISNLKFETSTYQFPPWVARGTWGSDIGLFDSSPRVPNSFQLMVYLVPF